MSRLDTADKRAAARAGFWTRNAEIVSTFTHPDGSEARVYRHPMGRDERPYVAAGFAGTAARPTFHYSYRTVVDAELQCAQFIESRKKHAAFTVERRAARKSEDQTSGYLSCAQTAVMVRETLARHLPGLKFSVRSSVYSGGASIDVAWTDGPRTAVVEPIVKRFAGATFDGMTDCKNYHSDVLVSETGMRVVHFGADLVFCHRTESDYQARHAAAEAMIRERCVCEGDRFGNHWVSDLASGVVRDTDYREDDGVERAFRRVVLRERD